MVRLVALAGRGKATAGAFLAHGAVRGAVLGGVCALAVALLLWQTFWHDLVDIGVAVAVSTLVAALLLVVPMRAAAGTFALMLSLSIVGLSASYFATGGIAASAGTASQTGTEQEVGGSDPANELPAADTDPAVIDSQSDHAEGSSPSGSNSQDFEVAVFSVPEASRPAREPVTPCHYRSRAWRTTHEKWSASVTGPCASRGTASP